MEMSFFVSCPHYLLRQAPKIGAHAQRDILYSNFRFLVPRFSGHAHAGCYGHGAKKDISMLMGLTNGDYVAMTKGQE